MGKFSGNLSTLKGKITLICILISVVGLVIIIYNFIFLKPQKAATPIYGEVSTTEDSSSQVSSSASNSSSSSSEVSSQQSSTSSSGVKVAVKSIDFDVTKKTLAKGEILTLNAKITPDNATDKTLKWTTSNLAVATVSDDGVVTAVGQGKASIRATNSNNTQRDTCVVTVTP